MEVGQGPNWGRSVKEKKKKKRVSKVTFVKKGNYG
jgi:hypothetical protein